MNTMQVREVSDGDHTVSYTLVRKDVKNINLRVKPDTSIFVSASPQVSAAYIDDFVCSKIPFILQAVTRMQQAAQAEPQLMFRTGERIPYFGGYLTLRIEPAERCLIPEWLEQSKDGSISHFSRNKDAEALFCMEGYLYLYTQKPEDPEHNRLLYESWQKIQAKILCEQLSRKYYPIFQELGVAWPMIKIRKMSSRWGSCIPKKEKVTFNSQLLEKPLESIEYVVVHEFAHFIHPNHSKAFYGFVEQILPDWRERKEHLRSECRK